MASFGCGGGESVAGLGPDWMHWLAVVLPKTNIITMERGFEFGNLKVLKRPVSSCPFQGAMRQGIFTDLLPVFHGPVVIRRGPYPFLQKPKKIDLFRSLILFTDRDIPECGAGNGDRHQNYLHIIFYIKRCLGCRQVFCILKVDIEIGIIRMQLVYLLECDDAFVAPAHAAECVCLVEPCLGIVWFDTDSFFKGVQLLAIIHVRRGLVMELILVVVTDIVEDLPMVYPGCCRRGIELQ